MKVLNLYAGIGGNRKLWENVSVTAVERNKKIAEIYQLLNPNDTVIIGDAHQYLIDHFQEFDFIWSSPPCQSHSKMVKATRHKKRQYPDLKLYEEIIFLQNFYKGKWVVENVNPYYEPLIKPVLLGRHAFWSNFVITPFNLSQPAGFIDKAKKEVIMDWLGIHFEGNIYYENNHEPAQVLRNCVHPLLGNHIFKCRSNVIQYGIFN